MTTPQQLAGQVYDPYSASFVPNTSDVQPTDNQPNLTTSGLWSPTNYGENGANGQFFLNDYQFNTNAIGVDAAIFSNLNGNAYDYGYQTNVDANKDFQQNSEAQNGGNNSYLQQFDQTEYKAQFTYAMMQSFQDLASYHNYGSGGPVEPWEDQILQGSWDGHQFNVPVNIFGEHPRQVTSGQAHFYHDQAEQFDAQLTQEGEQYAQYEATKSDLPTKTVSPSSGGSAGTGYRVDPNTVTQTGDNLENSQGNTIGSALEQFASGASAAFGNFPFGSEDASYIQAYRNALTFLAGLRKSVVQIGAGIKNGAQNYTRTSNTNSQQFVQTNGSSTTNPQQVHQYSRPQNTQNPQQQQHPTNRQNPTNQQHPTNQQNPQQHPTNQQNPVITPTTVPTQSGNGTGGGSNSNSSGTQQSGSTAPSPTQSDPTNNTNSQSGGTGSQTHSGSGSTTSSGTATSSSGSNGNGQQRPTGSKPGSTTGQTVPASSGAGQSKGQGNQPDVPSTPRNTAGPAGGTGTKRRRSPSQPSHPDAPPETQNPPLVPLGGTTAAIGGAPSRTSRPSSPSSPTQSGPTSPGGSGGARKGHGQASHADGPATPARTSANTPPGGGAGAGQGHGQGGTSGSQSLSGPDLPGSGMMTGGRGFLRSSGTAGNGTADGPSGGGQGASGSAGGDEEPLELPGDDDLLAESEVPVVALAAAPTGGDQGADDEVLSGSGEPSDEEGKREDPAVDGSGRADRRAGPRRDLGSGAPSAPLRQPALYGLLALPTSTLRRERKGRTESEHPVVKDWLVFLEPKNVVLGGAHRSARVAPDRPRFSSDLDMALARERTGAPVSDVAAISPEGRPILPSIGEQESGDLELQATIAKFSESAIFLAHQMRSGSWSALVDSGGGPPSTASEEPRVLELVGAPASQRLAGSQAARRQLPDAAGDRRPPGMAP